jgi:hypothetical protein
MALVGNMIANGKSAANAESASNNTLTVSIPQPSNGTIVLGSNSTASAITMPAQYGNAAIINFDMFAVAWAMLSLFYLILATLNESFVFHPALMLGLDVLNMFWFFIAAVATAAILGVHSCSNEVSLL